MTGAGRPAVSDRSVAGYRGPVVVAATAVVAATVALAGALLAGGVLAETVIPGLGDAGVVTRWGLPLARLLMDLTAVLTVGALLTATVLLPLTPAAGRARAKASTGPGRRDSGSASADSAAPEQVPADPADATDVTGTADATDVTGTTDTTEVTGTTDTAGAADTHGRTERAGSGGAGQKAGQKGGGAGRPGQPAHAGHSGPGLSAAALLSVRAASWLAAAWALAAAATLVFTVSDILGEPVGQVVSGSELSSYAGQLPQGTALMLVLLLAVVVSLLGRTTGTPAGAMGLLVLALIALLPPPLTGHSSAAANHSAAVTSLAMHVTALALWVGGLAAVAVYVWAKPAGGTDLRAVAVGRFSRLALWCYITVGVSGLVNVISRLPDPADLLSTNYGRLVLAKIAAFGVLGLIGKWHRDRTVKDLSAGRSHAFTRLAVAEVAVMAATIGLAVGLARTAPPISTEIETTVKTLIGYDMPPALTVDRLVSLWRIDFFFAVLVLVLGGLYLAGLVRLWRRGDRWPIGRTVAWFVGLLSIVLVTQSGVATYAPILFSVHMAQHMVLSMLTPIFLVLGGPVTLALRALKPAAVRGDRGPREWITVALHSRVTAFYAHPVVATMLFVVSTYALYFSPLFEAAMRSHLGHIAMMVHFLVSGTLFFWVIIGVDPAPKRLPPTGRLLVLFLTMPFHAFFGIALMNISQPLAEGWYNAMKHPWGSSILTDQHTGGSIAWGFGEIPTFIVLLALVFQWFIEDQRTARRRDRSSDRAVAEDRPDELADYNAYLASLEGRGNRPGG